MARQSKWQMEASDAVSWHQDQALNATVFLLRETGPTSFLLKEDGEEKRVKVNLGDPHSCTCEVFRKERNPCKHICWVILKRFKWPRTHELSYQYGLVEREINQLLHGPRHPRTKALEKKCVPGSNEKAFLKQREISKVDVCPICQEELLMKHAPVTYCKFGCGNNIHIKCMKIWAEHQRHTTEDNEIKCPICRASFGSFFSLLEELRNSSGDGDEAYRLDVHFSTSCGVCNMCPIKGKCYKCTTCTSFFLCNTCFHSNKHRQHSFDFRMKRTHRWRPAKSRNQLDPALEMTVLNDLSSREITENDYELLLQLDGNESQTNTSIAVDLSGLPLHIINSLPVMKVRHGGKLLAPGKQCRLCLRPYEAGQYVKKLPECKHVFHRDCIDEWLSEDHRRCPIDHKLVVLHRRATPSNPRQNNEDSQTTCHKLGDATQLIVPGTGIAKLRQSPLEGIHRHPPGISKRRNTRPSSLPVLGQASDLSDITLGDMLEKIDLVAPVPRHMSKHPDDSSTAMLRSRSGIEKGLVTRRTRGLRNPEATADRNNGLDLWLRGNSFANSSGSQSRH